MKKSLMSKTAGRIGLLAASALLVALPVAQADQFKNSAALPLDNVGAWVGGAVPGPTELAIFDSNIGTNPITCGISVALNIKGIVCSNNMGTNFLIVAGGKLTNGVSGIDMSIANKNFTIQAQPFALSASQTWDVGTNTLTLQNCTLDWGANTLAINSTGGGGTVVTPGTLSGSGAWTIGAGAKVKLSNGGAPFPVNTTTVNSGGVFDINQVNATASAIVNLNGTGISGGGALINGTGTGFLNGPDVNLQSSSSLGGAGNITISSGSPIAGSGDLTKVGAGTVTVNTGTTLSHSGGLTVSAGTLTINSGATCSFGGGFTNSAGVNTMAGANSFGGGVTVNGGTLTLSGAGTFPGGVNLNAGTLTLSSSTALGAAAGTFTINGGSTLGGNVTIANNNPVIINGDFTNSTGTLNLGTNIMTLGTAAGDTRTLTVNGTLTLGSLVNGTTATNLIKAGTALLNLNPTNSTFISGSITISNGTLNVGSINPSVPFTIPGNVAIRGTANKFQIGGGVNCTNIFNGNLIGDGLFPIFSQGLCVLGGDNSAFTGQFRVFRFAKLTNNKGVGGTLYMDRTYNAAYLDLNGLAVTGVDAIFSNLEGQGGTRVARLRNSSATPSSFAGNISMTTSNSVGVDGSGDMTLSGIISGTNGLTKLDAGKLSLTGPSTYSGPTTVSGGTLLVNGNLVGVTNLVTVQTNAIFGGAGTIGGKVTMDLGALALFTNGSTLTISGSLTANTNVVRLNIPANLGPGTYLLATYNAVGSSGSFASAPVIANGGSFAANTTQFITTAGGQVNLVVVNTYTVTYDGNTSDTGTVPVDANTYTNGATVTVLGNTGSLAKTNYVFANWNTAANGSGTSYSPAATFAIASNTTLYAQWTPAYTVTYNGNTSDTGTVPVDGNAYTNGATVTVLGNTGGLAKTNYVFANWNTAANGSGTSYSPAATFAIASNTTLYAQWTPSTPSATNITYTVSGGQMVLEWPNGQGWQLQSQTNNLNAGITTNWSTISGATSPFTNAIDAANPAVFYRLTYP